ncbi:MAG: TonB-dependent receptor [Caulobacteraceae bacterium]|nr:TonB-dependent receptor [Caulobacteraceae bacterium]
MSNYHRLLFAGVGACALLSVGGTAFAAAPATTDEIVVTADRTGLLERKPTTSVFGLNKPLIETPRSASFVSDTTLERYGIQTLDKLAAVSPGTYTASFYGVAGSVEIRGSLAENYFRGFKRIEDRGTYSTPIGDAAQVEIVRGPPTPLYGPGKIGGLVNFIPKSSKDEGHYLSAPTGEITATMGSYQKKNLTGQVGLPVSFGPVEGGIYAYGEADDSHSYYRGIYPKHQMAEISADFDLGSGWSVAFGGMGYHSQGDVQTPGWNRLTQSLIDNQTYTTGRDTTLTASPGATSITANQTTPSSYLGYYCSNILHGYPCLYTAAGAGLYQSYSKTGQSADNRFVLDTGVGTTKLDRRTVYVSKADNSRTGTATYYFDAVKELSNDSSIKLQLFYDSLSNKRYVSYGFPADYHAWTTEARLTYNFKLSAFGGAVTSANFVGWSDRHYQGEQKESYNSGVIALDRRDLSYGPTATDVIDPKSLGWETDIKSHTNDVGVFATTDITVLEKLDVILGGRYDSFTVSSTDTGILSYDAAAGKANKDKWTGTASITYKLPFGFMPYVTYAKDSALEIEQAGGIKPNNIISGGWLSDSDLIEGGVKFQLLHRSIVGSVAAYRQNRTQLSGLASNVQHLRAEGVEYEIRYLATDNISFTLTGDTQRTTVIGPDHSFVYVPAYTAGVAGVNAYGGAYAVFDFSQLPGRGGNYDYSLIPHSVVSLTGSYTTNAYSWGKAGATLGATYASKTSGLVQNAVTYPDYTIVNGSLFYQHGKYEVTANITNLFDTLYFTPDQDTYANVGAIPGRGREWSVTLKRKF